MKAEKPKAEKPKAEKPKAEKPKAEKAEKPKAEKAEKPKAEKAEKPKAEKAEKAEKPKAEMAAEVFDGEGRDPESDSEDDEINARVFHYKGEEFLIDETGCVYDRESFDSIGTYNADTETLVRKVI